MKTILVLTLGFLFFGKEGLNFHVALGMALAVVGMIWYGNASSKPGGKERPIYSAPSEKTQKHGILSSQSELDQKVWNENTVYTASVKLIYSFLYVLREMFL
jgi:hypothetical protein